MPSLLTRVTDGVYAWSAPDPVAGDRVGHLLETAEGAVLVDPPAAAGIRSAIEPFGPVRAVVLTAGHHDRAAGALRALFRTELWAPVESVDALAQVGCLVDHGYLPSDRLPGGLAALPAAVSASHPEYALHEPVGGHLFVADLVVARGGELRPGPACYAERDVASLVESLLRLLSLRPRTLLPSHGEPLLDRVDEALARLLGTLR
jgi:glyoxylase-like metal-dependent hydrolase (beta-lactamase superfamily II)